jgi:hypothetical protein
MTDTPPSLWAMVRERIKTKAIDWAVLGSAGLIVMLVFDPVRDKAAAIWNGPEDTKMALTQVTVAQDAILRDLNDLRYQVGRLSQPREVFELSIENSGPVAGFCEELEPCQISLKVRRTPQAVQCRVVPDSTQFGFINPRTDTYSPAVRIGAGSDANARNIGLEWVTINVTVLTPSGLEPEADFVMEAFYTACPSTMPDQEPVSYRSPRDRYAIRTKAP